MPKTRFPRTIHRIWIGPRPRPERFDEFWETWSRHNPGWECRTWVESDIEPLMDQLGLTPAYEWVTRAVQKADLARLGILWRHGGLYVDTDFECLKPLEPLVLQWEREGRHVVMSQHKHRKQNTYVVSNAIGLVTPRHHVVQWMARECQRRLHAARPSRQPHAVQTTGPGVWRAAADAFADEVLLLPQWMFNPLDDQMMDDRIDMSRIPKGTPIPSTAYAVHHSASLWESTPWKGKS